MPNLFAGFRSFTTSTVFCGLLTALAPAAYGDFSCASSTKVMASLASVTAPVVAAKTYIKRQKMRMETGNSIVITDLESQTVTTMEVAARTYTVRKLSDPDPAGMTPETKISSVRETGQNQTISGFRAVETVLVFDDAKRSTPVEMSVWMASGMPGAREAAEFYLRQAATGPTSARAAFPDLEMLGSVAPLHRQMAESHSIPIRLVVHTTAMIPQALPQPGADTLPPPAQEVAIELTTDYSDFSAAPIPDSVFDIPAGYTAK